MPVFAEIISSVLLFFLVYGMSATVEIQHLLLQMKNIHALLIGFCMQFIILPFIGFCCIKIFRLPSPVGITLLVVTSSPGGSYSNWWCSVFNAELALSVTMTALSTLLSTVMLPLNLYMYTPWLYNAAVVQNLDWMALLISICTVIGGITCGLITSAYAKRTGQSLTYHRNANRLGNIAGISLIALSIAVSIIANNKNKSSTTQNSGAMWNQDWTFYVGCALPVIIGLGIVTYASRKVGLEKPERVAVAIESCYQNTGIATSVALTMFSSSSTSSMDATTFPIRTMVPSMDIFNNTNTTDMLHFPLEIVQPTFVPNDNDNEDLLALALGVPLYYGLVEAIALAVFCIVCWKISWTKAPADENLCTVLTTSYEVHAIEQRIQNEQEDTSIEVVLYTTTTSTNNNGDDHDDNEMGNQNKTIIIQKGNLIFTQSQQNGGHYEVDDITLQQVVQNQQKEEDRRQRGTARNHLKNNHLNYCHRSDSPTEIILTDDEDGSNGSNGDDCNPSRSKSETNSVNKDDARNSGLLSTATKTLWRRYGPVRGDKQQQNALDQPSVGAIGSVSLPPAALSMSSSHSKSDDDNINNCDDTIHGTTGRSTDTDMEAPSADNSPLPASRTVRLHHTISRVRARAAGYQAPLTSHSSTDETTIIIPGSDHLRTNDYGDDSDDADDRIATGSNIIATVVRRRMKPTTVENIIVDNDSIEEMYYHHDNDDIDENISNDNDDKNITISKHRRKNRQKQYQTVETLSPSEKIQLEEAEQRAAAAATPTANRNNKYNDKFHDPDIISNMDGSNHMNQFAVDGKTID